MEKNHAASRLIRDTINIFEVFRVAEHLHYPSGCSHNIRRAARERRLTPTRRKRM